ncbi:MAG: carbohydrate ABC transporter permease, partial [Fusobacteriaceae bacterium]
MKKEELRKLKFILPAFIFVLIFAIFPTVTTLIMSFTNYSGMGSFKFIGLENYTRVLMDSNFLISIKNTIIWVIAGLIIPVMIPLVLAIGIFNSSYINVFKKIFYFPNAMSGVVTGLVMMALLSSKGIPAIFHKIGLESLNQNWLAIPYSNTFVMIIVGIWQGIGLNLILFIVALGSIDKQPVEAAKIDGATGFVLYTRIIFPLMRNTFVVVILMSVVNSLKTFDSIWVMTGGGPFRTSETLAVTMYREAFVNNNLSMGSAVAIILSIITLLVSYFFLEGTMKEKGM